MLTQWKKLTLQLSLQYKWMILKGTVLQKNQVAKHFFIFKLHMNAHKRIW